MKRLYVTLDKAVIFFDVPTKTWGVKSSLDSIDLDAIGVEVLKHLSLSSIEELCNYAS